VDTKALSRWSTDEALDIAGTNLQTMAREMARYIDTYRPDLAHLRDSTYKRVDKDGRHIQILSNFHAVEPYKIYLANASIKDICKTMKCPKYFKSFLYGEFYRSNGTATNGKSSIDLSSATDATIKGLATWLTSIGWGGSVEDALRLDAPSETRTLPDGEYRLRYKHIRPHDGSKSYGPFDKLTVLGNTFTLWSGSSSQFPKKDQRQSVQFESKRGLLTATGVIQLSKQHTLEKIIFKGLVGTDFLIGLMPSTNEIAMLEIYRL
jgi:hypothetical protein